MSRPRSLARVALALALQLAAGCALLTTRDPRPTLDGDVSCGTSTVLPWLEVGGATLLGVIAVGVLLPATGDGDDAITQDSKDVLAPLLALPAALLSASAFRGFAGAHRCEVVREALAARRAEEDARLRLGVTGAEHLRPARRTAP